MTIAVTECLTNFSPYDLCEHKADDNKKDPPWNVLGPLTELAKEKAHHDTEDLPQNMMEPLYASKPLDEPEPLILSLYAFVPFYKLETLTVSMPFYVPLCTFVPLNEKEPLTNHHAPLRLQIPVGRDGAL